MSAPRMAPATAFGFLVLGLSLLFAVPRRSALLHQALAVAGLLIGWVGLSRFVFGGEALFPFADMAVHTAILFLLTCGRRADIAYRSRHRRAARQRRCRWCDGPAPVAGGDRRAARGRCPLGLLRAPRHLRVRDRHRDVRAAQHDRVRGLRVGERGARRSRRSHAAARGARAASLRGASPAQLRSGARRHHHHRPPGLDHRLEQPRREDVRLVARRGDRARARRARDPGAVSAKPIGTGCSATCRAAWRACSTSASRWRHCIATATSSRWSWPSRPSASPRSWCSRPSSATSPDARGPRRRCAKASCASAPPPTPRRCSSG